MSDDDPDLVLEDDPPLGAAEERLMDFILESEERAGQLLADVPDDELQSIAERFQDKESTLGQNMWAYATIILVKRRLSYLGKLMPEGAPLMTVHELMTIEDRNKGSS